MDFGVNKTINEIDVFTLQDNWGASIEPTPATAFSLYGLSGYGVQYWNGSSWVTVPGGSVTSNNKIWRKFEFSSLITSKIRVLTNAAPDGVSRITEIEAYGPAETSVSGKGVQWLVADHLGTPRMIFDQSGSLANTSRHDYLPFGEEIVGTIGGRTPAHGYGGGDGVRQQFTQKERDNETGLDYFLARYYASQQGRFTSPDPDNAGVNEDDPQSWNAYIYARNSPVVKTDPDGLRYVVCDMKGNCVRHWDDEWKPFFDKKNANAVGITLQGDRDSGKIWNSEGQQIGTYQFIDQDYWSDFQNGVVSLLRDDRTWVEAGKRAVRNVTLQVVGLTVIGKLKDLNRPGAVNNGERVLTLPDKGNPRANWVQNSGALRAAMREGKPIRDASVNAITGRLENNNGFLRAERELLMDQGWVYRPETRCWHPPGQ